MSTPQGEGRFLLLIDYGTDGFAVCRYPTEAALKEAIQRGRNGGEPFLVAREQEICLFDYSEQAPAVPAEEQAHG